VIPKRNFNEEQVVPTPGKQSIAFKDVNLVKTI
jgi:hypothetical protein